MKLFIRVYGRLLIILISLSFLSCETKNNNSNITTITYFSRSTPEQLKVWERAISKFEEENPDIKVRIENVQYNSYWPKLQTMIAAGTPPDLIFLESLRFASYVKKNSLLPLNEFIAKDKGINLSNYIKGSLKPYTYKNKLYGLPNDIAIYVVFYNKELFDKVGIPYPDKDWTWDKYLTAAKRLTIKQGHRVVQYGCTSGPWWLWVWQNKGDIFDNPSHPQKFTLNSKSAKEAINFLHDLMWKYKVSPNATTLESSGGRDYMFLSGRIAMVVEGHWLVPKFRKAHFRWDVAPLPIGKIRANFNAGSCFSIVRGSKHPEAAYKLAKFLSGEKGQEILVAEGFSTPVRKDIINSPIFLNSGINEKVFIDEIKYAHLPPIIPNYDEVMMKISTALDKVWINTEPTDKVLNELEQEIKTIFFK